jgi:hypothetical protein
MPEDLMPETSPWRETFLPEHELLLCMARTRGAQAQAGRAQEVLRGGIDWPAVLMTALDHGVMPLLYKNFPVLGPETAPASFLSDLRALYLANTYRNLSLTRELLNVLAMLESVGVPVVAYKGPVLAMVAYGDTSLRQFSDLDLLVSRLDLGKVKVLLKSEGYGASYTLTPRQERAHLARTCELGFDLPDPRVYLDVHWRFAADYLGGGPDAGLALARRRRVNMGNATAPSLDPEDMLLVLCVNGAFHLWSRLLMVCDVAELIETHQGWDWAGLIERARSQGLLRMLLLGVSLAAELLGAPVPWEVSGLATRDPAVGALRASVMRGLFLPKTAEPSLLETSRFQLRALDGRRARVDYCWIRSVAPTVQDWQWVRLPDSLYFLYYLLRPLRLAVQGLARPLLRRMGLARAT